VRFTLVYNPGAAFGLHVGEHSRWIFMVLTIVALVILGRLYMTTRGGDVMRRCRSRSCVAGARQSHRSHPSPIGVVDFIDIGIGDSAGRRSTSPTWPSASAPSCSRGFSGAKTRSGERSRRRPRR
jgi:lipoprotein signal peptidase